MAEQQFRRSQGATRAERFLAKLCDRSFLRLWSYSGVCRDQAIGPTNHQGKEICDLLVVFGDHVIIFSDKDCSFQHDIPVERAWRRWAGKALFSSAKQIFEAERWLKENPTRVFTNLSCDTPLPLDLPPADKMIVHRIIVAHGASGACKKYYKSVRGSFILDTTLDGEADHYAKPFQVGHVNRQKGFVHIFDDVSLNIVLQTLDTVSDFTEYLQKKESFLCGSARVSAAGEEELLANYLRTLSSKGEHDFVIPGDYSAVAFEEGFWDRFQNHEQRRLQVAANARSYAWDQIIETFTHHTLANTHRTTTQKTIGEQEKLYRWLAREPRIRRRMLAEALIGIVLKTRDKFQAMRMFPPTFPGDPYYVFVVTPRMPNMSDHMYREYREGLLKAYCSVLRLRYPDALDIVGIATESGPSPEIRSEDLVYLDTREWSAADEADARELQKSLGLLTKVTEFRHTEHEYPKVGAAPNYLRGPAKFSRNKKCPCNSGKRYRKCHGKPL